VCVFIVLIFLSIFCVEGEGEGDGDDDVVVDADDGAYTLGRFCVLCCVFVWFFWCLGVCVFECFMYVLGVLVWFWFCGWWVVVEESWGVSSSSAPNPGT
jgi:hypothetical protein